MDCSVLLLHRLGSVLHNRLSVLDDILRAIGRPAFPIFCFLLVEGFLHTRDSRKYALRLFLFALISEIPFDLAIYRTLVNWGMQNVFFTLLIGLLVMMACTHFSKNIWMQSVIFALGLVAGYLLHTDYGFKGVLLIEILYFFRYDRKNQCIAGAISFSWEMTAPLAFLPIYFYNGKRGLSPEILFLSVLPGASADTGRDREILCRAVAALFLSYASTTRYFPLGRQKTSEASASSSSVSS